MVLVKAEGSAAKSEERADAKDAKKAALETALTRAVSSALDTLGDLAAASDPEALRAELVKTPRRFILNYRIVSEGWITEDPGPGLAVPPGTWPGDFDPSEPGSLWGEEDTSPSWGEEGWDEPRQFYHIRIEASIDSLQLRSEISRILSRGGDGASAVTVVLLDAVDYPYYSSFNETLKRIPMIKDVSYDSFYRGRIVYRVKAAGSALALKQRLAQEIGHSYDVQFGGPRTLTVRVAREAQRR